LSSLSPSSAHPPPVLAGCDSGSVAELALVDPTPELPSFRPPTRSLSIVFDEDKPIAASGAYNIEVVPSAGSPRHTLTRSLSPQGGDLEGGAEPLDGGAVAAAEDFHARAESFSVGTESAPGTLHRPKKGRPGSLKKKPPARQDSNPESPPPASSSTTPEAKRKLKPRTGSPLQVQDEPEASSSTTPSSGGTLRRARKSRVDTPPPLPEETTHTSPEESSITPALPAATQEETPLPALQTPPNAEDAPILPRGAYKWDPDNFDDIDPFNSGGSKIANSPELARKPPVSASTPPRSPPLPAKQPAHRQDAPGPRKEPAGDPEEQPVGGKPQAVRLEFDYSEESGEATKRASPPPKKLGKKPGAKMPLRRPKLGLKKAPPAQTEPLDNDVSAVVPNGNDEDIPIPKASYKFDPEKWEDPNFNPFNTKAIPNSPKLSQPSGNFDSFDDSVDPFKSSGKMANSPPKASASFEAPAVDNDADNDNDNVADLKDHNQNKPAKKKRTPIKS